MAGFVVNPYLSTLTPGETNFNPQTGSGTYFALTRNGTVYPVGNGYDVYHVWDGANYVAQAYNSGALDPGPNFYGVAAQTA